MWWLLCTFVQPQEGVLEDILDLVKTYHVDGDDSYHMDKKILAGALHVLDPYSAYFPPYDYRRVQQMGEGFLRGIGIEIQEKNEQYVVQYVIPNTPAEKAGLQVGDVLTHVDGIPIAPSTPPDTVIARLHGKPGTSVLIGINNCHIKIMRTLIKVPSVTTSLKNSVLFVHVHFFSNTTPKEIYCAIENCQKKGLQHVVLDLRSNPGGLLESAVETVGLFMDPCVVVHVQSRLEDYDKTYLCQGPAPFVTTPLVVWIDRYTASAAEVVVAAFQDYKRAKIVGGPSFGKGCIQDFFDLPRGYGGLKLTVGYCFSPSGRPIHQKTKN